MEGSSVPAVQDQKQLWPSRSKLPGTISRPTGDISVTQFGKGSSEVHLQASPQECGPVCGASEEGLSLVLTYQNFWGFLLLISAVHFLRKNSFSVWNVLPLDFVENFHLSKNFLIWILGCCFSFNYSSNVFSLVICSVY